MSWVEQLLHNDDDRTADWMARARTGESRARIRRWSRVETTGVLAILAGSAALLIAPIATLALIIWFSIADIDRTDVYWWLWVSVIAAPLLGGIATWVGGRQRLAACFADGHVSVGRVDKVIELPGGGDDSASYEVRVSAELPGGVVLRRKVYRSSDPRRRTGRPIRFRHNTVDPDDLHDVLFDGWAGETEGRAS